MGAPCGRGRVDLRRRGARLSASKLLVTGAGGQLGRAVAALRPQAVLLTRADLDVTDAGSVASAVASVNPDVVIHAAAWTAVDAAEADPDSAWAVNAGGTEAVARAAAASGALLLYPSTDYVFSGDASRPYREHDPLKPRTVYGRTKVQGEDAARTCPRHLIVRTSWLFGGGRNFVLAMLERARGGRADERASLEVVADQIGRPTYAPDLAGAILALAEGGHTRTFHVAGGGDPVSWADLADAALDAAVRSGLLAFRPRVARISTGQWASNRPGPVADRPRYSVLDCSRAEAAGITLRPWQEALEEYVRSLAARSQPVAVEEGERA